MSFVSDERAEIIRSLGRVFTMAARGCVNELLADRKERIEREEAVIAKLEKELTKHQGKFLNWVQEKYECQHPSDSERAKKVAEQTKIRFHMIKRTQAILAFIRNPKEVE